MLLSAIRREKGGASGENFRDIAFDLRTLGKDLVREVTNGRAADKSSDGRYVDIVSETGEKYRVITRVLRERGDYLFALVSTEETNPINYVKESEKPDAFVFVVVHPQAGEIDIFNFPLEKRDEKKIPNKTYNVYWSSRKRDYGKVKKNLWFTVKE